MLIGQDWISGEHEVGCSCGWEGHAHTMRDAAVDEWENHCDVAFMDACELSRDARIDGLSDD